MSYRFRLKLKDGTLIGNREVKPEWASLLQKDSELRDIWITTECRERGVEYISHDVTEERVDVLVKWC